LERLGEKSAQRILKSLDDSKQVPFSRSLFALGIRYVGETVAKSLAAASGNIDRLMEMTEAELTSINEIGERIAESVRQYFSDPHHLTLIKRLKEAGIAFMEENSGSKQLSDKLDGLSIVISGTFNLHSRDELKQMIELHGGKNVGSISKNTSYVLAGDNMGPSKLEKAQKLGVPIISEDDFLKMIH
jgi:DNA ligase (NAD+)